jgi:hypothetical protein
MAAALNSAEDLLSDSGESTNNSTSKTVNIGLIPRKDNFRKCKGKNSTSTPKPSVAKNPNIDNGKDKATSSSQDDIIKDMNIKLNTLMALMVNPSNDDPTIEESEDEEPEEDGLIYFNSISKTNEKQGPSINCDLALGVSEILKSGLKTEAKDKLNDSYTCPENCKRMEVVTCNPEILNSASSSTKKLDSTARAHQGNLMKGLMASCSAYNNIYTLIQQDSVSKKELNRSLKPLADAISLQAHASHLFDLERRQSFKKDIKDEFASLCSNSYPVDQLLFGDELQEKIKSADETSKLKQKVALPKNRAPFYKHKPKSSYRPSFFDQGSSHKKGGSQEYSARRQFKSQYQKPTQQAPQKPTKRYSNNNSNSNKKFHKK